MDRHTDIYESLQGYSLMETIGYETLPEESLLSPSDSLQLLNKVGEGGMGVVLKQPTPLTAMSIKQLKQDTGHLRWALINEAFIHGQIEHPCIVPIYDLILTDPSKPIVVMKKLDGASLADQLDSQIYTEQTIKEPIRAMIQLTQALSLAHEKGIIHRDIKPENIMFGRYGEVYLLDWGVAAIQNSTSPTGLVGTLAYMAPEMSATTRRCRCKNRCLSHGCNHP